MTGQANFENHEGVIITKQSVCAIVFSLHILNIDH